MQPGGYLPLKQGRRSMLATLLLILPTTAWGETIPPPPPPPPPPLVHIDFPPPLACLDHTALPVAYRLIVTDGFDTDGSTSTNKFNNSDICFTLSGMEQSWCGPLASMQTPLFEQISPGWHHLVYWVEPHASNSSIVSPGSGGSSGPARTRIPFRVSDPDHPDCAARCPRPLQPGGADANIGAAEAWLCPESETQPQLYIVTPRPGRIVSTETRIPISVKIEGLSTPQDRLHFELLRHGSEEGDLLDLWTTHASPGQLSPLSAGDYRLTVRLVRVPTLFTGGSVGDWQPYVIAEARPLRFHVRDGAASALDEGSYLREEGFRQIWVDKYWGVAGMGSGQGSTLEASENDRAFLTDLVLQHGIRRLYDAGCGTAHWQPRLLHDLQDRHGWTLHYHGSDIVPEVIERNRQQQQQQQHGNDRQGVMTFTVADLVRDPVPGSPDLILCRHALFHNTNDAIRAILGRFNASTTARWLAATTVTYFGPEESSLPTSSTAAPEASGSHLTALNRDGLGTDGRLVAMGGYRPVDLTAPPFSLPPPLAFRDDGTCRIPAPDGGWYIGGLGVWRLPLPPWPAITTTTTTTTGAAVS